MTDRTALLAFALLATFAGACFAAEEADPPQRTDWNSTSPGDRSVFRKQDSGDWLELKPNGGSISFEQSDANDEYVELFDPGRAIRIRFGAERSRMKIGDRDWFDWLAGGWVEEQDLPDWAYLAPVDHRVRLVYFVPKDREPTANWREKIVTLMTFVNDFYKDDFRRRGWNDRGLIFETNEQGTPIVHLLHGERTAVEYNGAPEYDVYRHLDRCLSEIPPTIGDQRRQLVVSFLETYDSGDAPFEWPGGLALGGQRGVDGGMASFSAWILRDEFCATSREEQLKLLTDATPIEGRKAHGHPRMNSPRFEFIEDGFGAVIHEVGHALGLPHDQRRDDRYIMGNGFRNLRVNLNESLPLERRVRFSDENARLLKQSRHLNPDWDREDRTAPKVELSLSPGEDGKVAAKVVISDDRELASMLFFDTVRGSVVDGQELQGAEATIEKTLDLRADETSGERSVEAFVIDKSGRITRVTERLKKAE
ncbi:MAG TPA: hypothetical protein VGN57_14765 [Pirellulaceae bacterium]|jgi:hypothetical protein|nr:hypothetical protein [Pirellulaceae bacterium]